MLAMWTSLPTVCRGPGRGRREVKICAVPRTMVVGGLAGLGLLLMYWSRALLTLAWALVLGEGCAWRPEQELS